MTGEINTEHNRRQEIEQALEILNQRASALMHDTALETDKEACVVLETRFQDLESQRQKLVDELSSLPAHAPLMLDPAAEFQSLSDELFLRDLDPKNIAAIEVMGHTGEHLVTELLDWLDEIDDDILPNRLEIRILVRNPKAEASRRAQGLANTLTKVKSYSRHWPKLRIQFYENLPVFRGYVCHLLDTDARIAFLHFYHFPRDRMSKRYPSALSIDERNTGQPALLVDLYSSWFRHYWGKTDNEIHTIIFDFDDTIVNSHHIQIQAWVKTIGLARTEFGLSPDQFHPDVRNVLDSPDELVKIVTQIFFTQSHDNPIFPRIFGSVPERLGQVLRGIRYQIRERQIQDGKAVMFDHVQDTLVHIRDRYHLMIVSATDEDMIQDYLSDIPVGDGTNLLKGFLHVLGKKEPAFEWEKFERKSQLILKIVGLIGVPADRLVYVGDNDGDFQSCKRIGIDFVEAKLFRDEVEKAVGRDSLIMSGEPEWVLTDWRDFETILSHIERAKRARKV